MFEIETNMVFCSKKIMSKFTLCGFSPINILAIVYIMYFILFQCIRIIESEKKNYDFLARKLKKPTIFQIGK